MNLLSYGKNKERGKFMEIERTISGKVYTFELTQEEMAEFRRQDKIMDASNILELFSEDLVKNVNEFTEEELEQYYDAYTEILYEDEGATEYEVAKKLGFVI